MIIPCINTSKYSVFPLIYMLLLLQGCWPVTTYLQLSTISSSPYKHRTAQVKRYQ